MSIYVGQLNDQVGEKKQIKKRKVKGDFGFRRKKGKKVSSLGCFLCLENETFFCIFFGHISGKQRKRGRKLLDFIFSSLAGKVVEQREKVGFVCKKAKLNGGVCHSFLEATRELLFFSYTLLVCFLFLVSFILFPR